MVDSSRPVSPAIIEAMKRRIIEVSLAWKPIRAPEVLSYATRLQLEDQLAAQPPPAKRARKAAEPAATAESSTTTTGAAPANTKAEDKKRKLQLKKIFDRYALD